MKSLGSSYARNIVARLGHLTVDGSGDELDVMLGVDLDGLHQFQALSRVRLELLLPLRWQSALFWRWLPRASSRPVSGRVCVYADTYVGEIVQVDHDFVNLAVGQLLHDLLVFRIRLTVSLPLLPAPFPRFVVFFHEVVVIVADIILVYRNAADGVCEGVFRGSFEVVEKRLERGCHEISDLIDQSINCLALSPHCIAALHRRMAYGRMELKGIRGVHCCASYWTGALY